MSLVQGGRFSLSAQVAALFASGMKGAWYERSNSATLYQESTGITPTVTAGQPIGLGLSRDQGLVRGVELITNPSFDSGSTGWNVFNTDATHIVTFSGGTLRYQSDTQTPVCYFSNGPALVVGKMYELTIDTAASNGAGLLSDQLQVGLAFGGLAGIKTYRTVCKSAGAFNLYRSGNNVDVTLNAISVKEIPGNHQLQATATARPLYQITPQRLVYDGVDDVLNTTLAAALGTNCTVGWAIPGTGAVISTAQNIGTTYADNVTACALVILDGPLNSAQATSLTAYLNQQSAT